MGFPLRVLRRVLKALALRVHPRVFLRVLS